MSFKDQLLNDIQDVFLNLSEFGEWISLNGRRIQAVVEAFDVEFDQTAGYRPGVSLEGLVLHVSECDAPGDFRAGKEIRFNDESWFILDANRDDCLRTIRIYRELS